MDTANETSPATLRGFFFPLPSPGHMIPLIDIAKLLSRRGVSVTIVTTPGNEPLARPAIDSANSYSSSSSAAALPIDLILLPFPESVTSLLPPGNCENLTNVPPSYFANLMNAFGALRPSLQDLLRSHRADFLITDNVLVWAADVAAELGIPHIVFSGHGAFPLCVHERLAIVNPLQRFSDDDTAVILIDDIPNPIQLTEPEVSDIFNYPPMLEWMKQAEEKSFGVVVNSFYALEPAYVDIFRRGGHRAWFVGPVSLSNAEDDRISQANRGREAHLETARLMSWLDAQPAGSVVYACFGSLCDLDAAEMREMAVGLEESGRRFIWAVRDWQGAAAETTEWLPEGFEERVESKGWVVRGWAPQVAILGHAAVGAFVTHCGWNSVLEGVTAGLPLVARPLMYEQFVNQRLITDVLKVGVKIGKGAKDLSSSEVAAAVRRVMSDGEEAEGFRRRARELAAAAKAAMEVGGSSFEDVGRMVEGLKAQVGREGSGGKKDVG